MLITTGTGIVVHTDHIAYIALKRHPPEDREPVTQDEAPRFKVLLCLANHDMVVAASHLKRSAAEFLRTEIALRWVENVPSLDVKTALQRHEEGAYFAQDAR